MKNQKLLKNLKCRGNLLALLLTIVASLFTYNSAWAGAGFWDEGTFSITFKGSSTETFSGNKKDVETKDLGTVTSLSIDKWQAMTWKDNSGNICDDTYINYKFSATGTEYKEKGSVSWNDPSQNNNKFYKDASTIVLVDANTAPGDYTVEIWFTAKGNENGGGCDGTMYASNDSKNYKVTYTVPNPAPSGDAPTVLIAAAPSVSGSTATLFGYLKLTGCQNVTDYGFIWSTTQSDIEGTAPSGGTTIKATYPTGDITVGSEGTEFKAEDKEFTPLTTIYYRAYATNAIGTSYSEEIRSFSTSGCIKPVVTDIEVPASICSNANTITATATATAGSTFVWSVDGTVFTAASGTTATATITVGAAGTGSITVTPTKEGCEGNPFTRSDITVKDATITAKNLKVDDESTTEGETIDFCEGQEITFKITSDYDVTTYTWSFPTGWTIKSGEGTKEVVVTASATSGTVSATIANDCGNSATRTIEANVTAKPATPGEITGAASVCKGTPQTYSVEAVSGATGYEWILPTGWTGTCDPEGGNTITATPGADAESGTIKVKATNDCGGSEYNTGIAVTVGGYSIAISGVGAKSDAATYPWEYMTLTATTDATNITWNCVYSGTVATDLTVFETNGKTAKLKSGAEPSDDAHYTVTASTTEGGCQTTSPGYDVYINAADIEICD